MPISNVTAVRTGGTIRVTGTKGATDTVRAYLNPDAAAYPTAQALYDGYNQITTPKGQAGPGGTSFDISLTIGDVAPPYTVRVVASDGSYEGNVAVTESND